MKVRVSYQTADGYTQRELVQIDDQPIVQPADSMNRALAVPVEAGVHRFEIGSAPLVAQRHFRSYASEYGINTYTYESTHQEQGCGRAFRLDVESDATYRVELNYRGPNQCDLTCVREIQTPQGAALFQCPNFIQ
ncbi:MAG: hypothetical protein AAGE52_08735 [Myxococcota bacterium]